jgi:hypothetical protein
VKPWAAVLCLSDTKVLLVQEELPKQQVTILPHHPCSLDLTPCDFFFFPRLKEKLCGRQFLSAKEVAATREAVWDLPADIFQQCFQQLYQRWQDLHSGQRRLFWGWMWICVSVCEYLLIWCDKTTVHEIDCSSITNHTCSNCYELWFEWHWRSLTSLSLSAREFKGIIL